MSCCLLAPARPTRRAKRMSHLNRMPVASTAESKCAAFGTHLTGPQLFTWTRTGNKRRCEGAGKGPTRVLVVYAVGVWVTPRAALPNRRGYAVEWGNGGTSTMLFNKPDVSRAVDPFMKCADERDSR